MSLLARMGRALGRRRPSPAPPAARLDDVRRRLELLLAAIYGQPVGIAAAEAPRPRRSLGHLLRRTPAHLRTEAALATSDGERILLPPELPDGDPAAAAARYRLLALEQAERMARGTVAYVPQAASPLERDLFLLLESAAVDRFIARAAPGVARDLAGERAAALARRPPAAELMPAERRVEEMVVRLLAADPAEPPADLAPADTPADSLLRAREMAARIAAEASGYRGLPAVDAWGGVPRLSLAAAAAAAERVAAAKKQASLLPMRPLPGMRSASEAKPGQDDAKRQAGAGASSSTVAGDVQEPGEDAGSAAGGSVARDDAPQDVPEDTAGTGGQPRDARDEKDLFKRPPRLEVQRAEGTAYPEWDHRAGAYVQRAATVREVAAPSSEGDWPAAVLRHHAATVRRLREKFERLQARRLRLSRQRDGDELDLSAVVAAMADVRAGLPVDDRLYSMVRPARRGLAIMLLVDISGSTSDEVSRGVRIIDLEKVALLLTAQALDALGDAYAVLTFSGQGPHGVRMRTVKDFDERNGEAVRQRMGALQPEGYTRLGAAVRHATARLRRPEAGHRLLLIISDGKPNDTDDYAGRYGIEDSRQAIAEARQAGVFPFCLTVDRAAASYLPRIFGASGHEILRRPEHLPLALSGIVQHLLRA